MDKYYVHMLTLRLFLFIFKPFFHQVIPDSSTTLVLSLHHPQSHVREIAIKHLGDLLRGKEVFNT